MVQNDQLVKLYIYQFENEKILIDTQEAKDFGEFVLVGLDSKKFRDQVHIEELQKRISETFPGKKVLIVDQGLDIAFYGFKQQLELESSDGS